MRMTTTKVMRLTMVNGMTMAMKGMTCVGINDDDNDNNGNDDVNNDAEEGTHAMKRK